jgi:hypothetical protein
MSIGEVNSGLYYKNKQQYLSATSGFWTIIGLLVILGLSINVFVNISNRTSVETETSLIDSTQFNLKDNLSTPVSV